MEDEKYKVLESSIYLHDQAIAAVAIRLGALESLLLKKGIVSEAELIESQNESTERFKKALEEKALEFKNGQ